MKRNGIGIVGAGFTVLAALVMSVLFFVPWGERQLEASTAAGIVITNLIRVDWQSGSVPQSTNATNTSAGVVGTNYGMTWIGITNQTAISGSDISNDTYLTNDGNETADFILTFTTNAYANANSFDWPTYFTNLTTPGPSSANLSLTVASLSPANVAHIQLFVSVPSTESNNAFIIYQCMASNSNAAADLGTHATNYTGFNGIEYGGHMGKFGAPSATAFLSNDTTAFSNWTVTALYAGITVSKTAEISNPGPYGANVEAIPGAIITYKLDFTNKGGAPANAVKIVDTLPTNFVTLVPASFRYGLYADTFANYGSLSNLAQDENDGDSASTNSGAADELIFCPTNGNAPGTPGVIDPSDSGAYFYRTYLK
jgi:uncharacterized repeat protein (TIGR01451 family)